MGSHLAIQLSAGAKKPRTLPAVSSPIRISRSVMANMPTRELGNVMPAWTKARLEK